MPVSTTIDFRSDMLGRRPEHVVSAMIAAAASQPSMDEDDRYKRLLEETAADLLGFDDALFLPTCTMADQIVVRWISQAGGRIIADDGSHLVQREADAATQFHGAKLHAVQTPGGHVSPAQVADFWAPVASGTSKPLPGGVWLEETHNASGGATMPHEWLAEITRLCRRRAAWLHVDGARIWNASVATGRPLRHLTAGANSLAVSLNKCLDAPVGGLLLGSRDFICWAQSVRTDLGGRWRPIGMLAAAALAAMTDFQPRLEAIHRRAYRFYEMLANALPNQVGEAPQSNIVMLGLGNDEGAERFLSRLRSDGVDALAYGSGRVRFVLHSGILDDHLEPAIISIRAAARESLEAC